MNVHDVPLGGYLYLRADFFPHTKHAKNEITTEILDTSQNVCIFFNWYKYIFLIDVSFYRESCSNNI